MRKVLWQLHSWLGLLAGLGLLVIGVTGSALVFREEMMDALHPRVEQAVEKEGAALGIDTLVARARAQLPGQEVVAWDTLMHQGKAHALAVVHLDNPKEWRWIDADPTTGNLLPEHELTRAEKIFDWTLELHYALLMGDWGVVIAGVLAVLLCLLGISGVVLYRNFWKNFFTLRWGRSARIFSSDLHKMVGISSVAFNLMLGITGAWWNLPTLKTLLKDEPVTTNENASTFKLYNTKLSFEALAQEAAKRLPGLDPTKVYLSLPPREEHIELTGSVVSSGRFVDEYNSSVTFDAQTGAVLKVTDFRNASLLTKFEAIMGPLHFGTFGGWPVKLLWCVLSLAPGILAVSGFVIWYRRRVGRVCTPA